MAILQSQLSTMSREALEAAVMAMSAQGQRKLSLKVSEKGAVSCYGLGRFPVTLYAGQWERLLGDADAIREFIRVNSALLSVKPYVSSPTRNANALAAMLARFAIRALGQWPSGAPNAPAALPRRLRGMALALQRVA